MADTVESGASVDQTPAILTPMDYQLHTRELLTTVNTSASSRHSTPGDLFASGKRYGVADFDQLGSEVLEEFDPMSPNSGKKIEKASQNSETSAYLLTVAEDKSLARHSAPGLLFGSQNNGECSSNFGASLSSSDDLSEKQAQNEFEHNQFDDDLERSAKKELEQMDGAQEKETPIYPSLSLSNNFHNVARHRIVSVSGSDKSGRLVIVFSACRIPALHFIDHHQLYLYMKHTLDQYVESDYTIVYFHYGLTSKNKPSFHWLMQIYRELGRTYRKNIKALFIVHPSNFIKILLGFFRNVTSRKSAKKVTYVNCLQELSEHIHLNQLDIPQQVQDHDSKVITRYKPRSAASSVFHANIPEIPKTQQFGVSLSWMKEDNDGDVIPRCINVSIAFLIENGLKVEGIFRRSASSLNVKKVTETFNLGRPVDYAEFGDIHCAAAIIKKFLRELPEPLLTFELFDTIRSITATSDRDEKLMQSWSVLHDQLPSDNFKVLKFIMVFLKKVQDYPINKMTASNLAIVFGPNLVWGKTQAASLDAMAQINTFTCLMLENVDYLFRDT